MSSSYVFFSDSSVVCDHATCNLQQMQFIQQVSVKGFLESDRNLFLFSMALNCWVLSFIYLCIYLFIYLGQRDGFGTATMITAQLWSSCLVVVDGELELLLFIMAEQTGIISSNANSLKYKI